MPPKTTYETVRKSFESIGCKLLTESYENNKQPLLYLCECGHTRTVSYCHIKTYKNTYNYNKCKQCFDNKKYFGISENNMNPFTYKKIQRLMERKYEMTKKYRSDYLPENYNKEITCWSCKETKSIKLFPYRKQYKDNKEKRCKKCNNQNKIERKENHTIKQVIQEMITSARNSAFKREKNGRKSCGIITITVKDILDLKEKQNNKCIYSGRELIWKRNDNNKASIDRINSNKGYTKDNIQLVNKLANQAKSNLTHKEFLKLVKDIYKTSIKE